jgi:hypothetical protein
VLVFGCQAVPRVRCFVQLVDGLHKASARTARDGGADKITALVADVGVSAAMHVVARALRLMPPTASPAVSRLRSTLHHWGPAA